MKIEIKGFTAEQTADFQKAFDGLGEDLQKAVSEKLENLAGLDALNEVKGLVEKSGEDFGTLQKSVDDLTIKLEKAQTYVPKESVKSFASELKETLTKQAEALVKMKSGDRSVKDIQMEVKSFLETSDTNVTTGSLLPQYQYDPGISKAPDRAPFMMDLVTTAVANSLTIFYTQRKTRTDNSEWVAEGVGASAQNVLGYETKTAVMQNLSAFTKVSNNSIDDISWLMSEIRTELVTLLVLKVDVALLNGTVAANGFDGVNTVATAFDADGDALPVGVTPTRYDALKFALTQVKLAHFKANAILLDPTDVRDMELERDGRGAYLLPPFMQSLPGVGGVRIVENTGITAGDFLVGDMTKAKFWVRKGLEVKIYDQNEDDALNQLKTITGYMRGTLVVKEADKKAFVKGTFTDAITEITHA